MFSQSTSVTHSPGFSPSPQSILKSLKFRGGVNNNANNLEGIFADGAPVYQRDHINNRPRVVRAAFPFRQDDEGSGKP